MIRGAFDFLTSCRLAGGRLHCGCHSSVCVALCGAVGDGRGSDGVGGPAGAAPPQRGGPSCRHVLEQLSRGVRRVCRVETARISSLETSKSVRSNKEFIFVFV